MIISRPEAAVLALLWRGYPGSGGGRRSAGTAAEVPEPGHRGTSVETARWLAARLFVFTLGLLAALRMCHGRE